MFSFFRKINTWVVAGPCEACVSAQDKYICDPHSKDRYVNLVTVFMLYLSQKSD